MSQTNEVSLERAFGLARPNFILDPETDWECFARRDINVAAIVARHVTKSLSGTATWTAHR
jgi:hypothetical protein